MRALDGGVRLEVWRRLLPVITRRSGLGRAVAEIGRGQAEHVSALAAENGLVLLASHADLAGRTRCLVLGHEGDVSGA